MRRRALLVALIGLLLFALLPHGSAPAVASPRASGEIVANEALQTAPALTGGTIQRSQPTALPGEGTGTTGGQTLLFTSDVAPAGQLFDHVGVRWIAAPGTEGSMHFELRTSADARTWGTWEALKHEEDMVDHLLNEWYAAPLRSVDGARFAQYRVWLTSGELDDLRRVGITFMDVSDLNAGPVARLLNDVKGAFRDMGRSYAAAAPVGVPRILTRQDWAADERLMDWTPRYEKPVQKAVVHHTVTSDGGNDVAATIRSVYYFHAVTRGWGDIGYNYLVDKYGNIWTGRIGGDHVTAGHAIGWNQGSIGVAAIGDYSVTKPTPAMIGGIANIIALKFAQLGIQPFGAEPFTHFETKSDGEVIEVTSNPPNIQGHRDCVWEVGKTGAPTACPGGALYNELATIRSLAQNAVSAGNGYQYLVRLDPNLPDATFPGNILDVPVVVTNRGAETIPAGTSVSYQLLLRGNVVLAQGERGILTADLPAGATTVVSVPFISPMTVGSYVVRWDLQIGTAWWSQIYGPVYRDMWFRSSDWGVRYVTSRVPRAQTAGAFLQHSVTLRNDGGRVWPASGANPVQLRYHWTSAVLGNRFDGANFASLPQDVPPGESVTLSLLISVPAYPTTYELVLDLRKENEFWFSEKGLPVDRSTVAVGLDFQATYSLGAVPPIAADQTVTVPVTITNTGRGTFPTTGSSPVTLGYHWYDGSGQTVVWDGARTKLPSDLPAGASILLQAQVTAPPAGGQHTLAFDLVQEGVAWFMTKGVPTGKTQVAVAGPFVRAYGAAYQPGVTTLAFTGAQSTLPITITNTSNFTWPSSGEKPINLGYHWADAQGRTVVWDGLRTKLTADLQPGGSVTVNAAVRFPSAAGTYLLRWDMVEEGVAWFSGHGVHTFDQPLTVTSAQSLFYGGSFEVSGTPATMAPGVSVTVPIKVQNLSNFAWDSSINLAYHWYDAAGNVVVWDGARTPLSGMAPQELRAIDARIDVPSTPGTYTLRYDIVHEGVTWFSGKGMQTPTRTVKAEIPGYAAVYTVPANVAGPPGAVIGVPVTVRNAGAMVWQPGTVNLSYHIYGQSGLVFVWDGWRTAIPVALATGQELALVANVELPVAPGLYTVRFDLVQEGVTWFSEQGVSTAAASLSVQ